MSTMNVVVEAVAASGARISAGAVALDAVADAPALLPLDASPLEADLSRALAGFGAAWAPACGHLAQEVRTLGDTTSLVAAAYRDGEWARTARTDQLTLRLSGARGGA